MFIYNKVTKTIQECGHKDVIKACKSDAEHYLVTETKEELTALVADDAKNEADVPQNEPQTNVGKEDTTEDDSKASEGENEGENDAEDDSAKPAYTQEALEAMKVADLRTVAKEVGITGYGNMDKNTLVAMILDAAE